MSSTSKTGDITFKSSSEIKSFVRHQIEKSGYSGSGAYVDRASSNLFAKMNIEGALRDSAGKEI
jgi:hypothetical protein